MTETDSNMIEVPNNIEDKFSNSRLRECIEDISGKIYISEDMRVVPPEDSWKPIKVKMTNKVYIVTSGEYSDYHIVGVYSTREKAEQLIKDIQFQREYPNNESVKEWVIDYYLPLDYRFYVTYDSKDDFWDCDFVLPYEHSTEWNYELNKVIVNTKYRDYVRNEEFDPNIEDSEWKGLNPYNIYSVYVNVNTSNYGICCCWVCSTKINNCPSN